VCRCESISLDQWGLTGCQSTRFIGEMVTGEGTHRRVCGLGAGEYIPLFYVSSSPADHGKTLASQVDALAHFEVNDTNTRMFLQQFLGSDSPEMSFEDARASLARVNSSIQPAHKYLTAAAHVIFRYRLLDIVADVLECPRHPDLVDMPRIARPGVTTTRLDSVCELFNHWSSAFTQPFHRCLPH
jgi:hypothetical protein